MIVGIVYGLLMFVEVPFLALGGGFSVLGDLAFCVNGLSVLPVCILGFWFRRTACACLAANALLTAVGLALGKMIQAGEEFSSTWLKVAPTALALCSGLLEFVPRWIATPKGK